MNILSTFHILMYGYVTHFYIMNFEYNNELCLLEKLPFWECEVTLLLPLHSNLGYLLYQIDLPENYSYW